ncbi:MAG: hypothetical protein AAAC48_01045, partial [Phyllobacterium sp.]|uniref:hypothetical protein n=1 Tax=Phyllobacterium sp. TaxID=1871046 RepID=UPI0030F034C5
ESQKAELRRKIREGNGNYVEAYKYLHKQVQSKLHCADLSAARRKELEAQEFWLRKATEINGNDPDSQANHFIRGVTRNGLRFETSGPMPRRCKKFRTGSVSTSRRMFCGMAGFQR